jgi:hypothetical protein
MKPAMTIDEALEYADLWRSGTSIREDSGGWSDVCMLLAEEVRRLRDDRDQAIKDEREACAKVCENRAEERFFEFGVIETDTGAGYYDGKAADEHESRDEEDESCAAAIRARSKKTEGA